MKLTKTSIEKWFKKLQDSICESLKEFDNNAIFTEDKWKRAKGGGGKSRSIKNGSIIEKGGVNFSAVSGVTPKKILRALNLPQVDFYATGISIVLHPKNPWVPIIHMNVRYFEMSNKMWWFGGGIDLTPHFVFPEKAKKFHQNLKKTCDKHSPDFYPKFKLWADNYFYLKHRDETRGIGGIFIDKLSGETEIAKEKQWLFIKDIGETFIPIYTDAIKDLENKKWTEKDKNWQKIRRGRYAEFNLIYDKGTKFGLDTNGQTESILMSLPPEANWEYNYQPKTTLQKQTLASLKKGIDWINI